MILQFFIFIPQVKLQTFISFIIDFTLSRADRGDIICDIKQLRLGVIRK